MDFTGLKPREIKVLAVDDDLLVRKILTDIFKKTCSFTVCSSAADFRIELETFHPDIVLLDVVLPDGNGIDLCAELRKDDRYSELYILILTSFEDTSSIEAAYSAGANDYIRKPFIPFEILSKIGIISRTIEYQDGVVELYNRQKKLNGRLYLLTELIRKSLHNYNKDDLILTAFNLASIVSADFCEIILLPGDDFQFKKKIFTADFSPVSYSSLASKSSFFNEHDTSSTIISVAKKDGTKIRCLLAKLIYNKSHIGFVILQKESNFSVETRDIVSLYLDFININGSEIEARHYLMDEVQKERKELSKVRSLQVMLLPDFKEIERYDIASTFIPMDEISGDFFDAFYVTKNIYQIVLCDVAGHGMASSYIGSSIRSLIRSVSTTGLTPAQIAEALNESVVKNLSNTYYFSSLILCSMNLDTDEITIVSAGHPPCFFYHAEHRQYEMIEKTGPLVGLISGSVYEERKFLIKDDDCIFMYTDGVTEAQTSESCELYGENRLYTLFQEITDLDSIEIVHSVVGSVYEYTGYEALNDDVTAICIKKRRTLP